MLYMKIILSLSVLSLAPSLWAATVAKVHLKRKVLVVKVPNSENPGFNKGDTVKISSIHEDATGRIRRVQNNKIFVKVDKVGILVARTPVDVSRTKRASKNSTYGGSVKRGVKGAFSLGVRGGMVLNETAGFGGEMAIGVTPKLQLGIHGSYAELADDSALKAVEDEGDSELDLSGIQPSALSGNVATGMVFGRYYLSTTFYMAGGIGGQYFQNSYYLVDGQDQVILREMSVTSGIGYAGIGNRWFFDNGVYIGAEWAAGLFSFYSSTDGANTAERAPSAEAETARYSIEKEIIKKATAPGFQAAVVQVGLSF